MFLLPLLRKKLPLSISALWQDNLGKLGLAVIIIMFN